MIKTKIKLSKTSLKIRLPEMEQVAQTRFYPDRLWADGKLVAVRKNINSAKYNFLNI